MARAGFVGVPATCCGVAENSARVPFSVSSFQRTPRLVLEGDFFFFIGENWTPDCLTLPINFRRGDDFIGDEVRCDESAIAGNDSLGIAIGRMGED
jgi:hypothetical protein